MKATPALLRMPETGQLEAGPMVGHRFALDDFEQAYRVFGDAADTGALEVILSRT